MQLPNFTGDVRWCDVSCTAESLDWKKDYGINENRAHNAHSHHMNQQSHTTHSYWYDAHTLWPNIACTDVTAAHFTYSILIHWGDLWFFYENWPNCLIIHVPVQGWMVGGSHNGHKNNTCHHRPTSDKSASLHICVHIFMDCMYKQAITLMKETMWLVTNEALIITI